MGRPRRIDYNGAIHHVAVNGNNQQDMFVDAIDRRDLLSLLGSTADRYGWEVWSYCLMDTHWHLVVRTPKTLSAGMKRLNSCYSRRFNEHHGRSGHSIRHKFMSRLVEDALHQHALSRYIPLNPVKAGIVSHPEDWPWSSYLQALGREPAPDWLHLGWVGRIHGSIENYRRHVESGADVDAVTLD